MLKQKKAITLIALIVTIIVLLILTGVVINMTFGENGFISKSMKAQEQHVIVAEKEAISRAWMALKMDLVAKNIAITADL